MTAGPGAAAPVRAVIIDDEPPARKRLRALLSDDGRLELAGEAGDGVSAVSLIESVRPDVAFLDIQMPELDGFEVLDAVDGPLPRIVFVTAFDEFALQAFDTAAADYLLKPVERERFRRALDRVLAGTARASPAGSDDAGPADDGPGGGSAAALEAVRLHVSRARPLSRVLVRRANRMVLVAMESVEWLEAAGNYVRLRTRDESYLLRATLSGLEHRLDPDVFVRIHRSSIVNLDAVVRFETVSHGDWRVYLRGGVTLRLSRRYRDRLAATLGG